MRIIISIVALLLTSTSVVAQSITQPYATVEEYVTNVLLGEGVTVSNITYTGSISQLGLLEEGFGILSMDAGLMLNTGNALCETEICADCLGAGNDPDLLNVANSVPPLIGQSFNVGSVNDLCVIEFDFEAWGDSISFNYVFGSDEYLTFVNTQYLDVFAFFLSGPGINGPFMSPVEFPGGAINLAQVPNSNPPLPITISSVNNVTNPQFYIDNPGQLGICTNGYTVPFLAEAAVQCGETYHIKLAIADGSDAALESFVVIGNFNIQQSGCSGCTVEVACNYDPTAVFDDGTCYFNCPGCTDETACNYDAGALQDDGSCSYFLDFGWCNCDEEVLDALGVCGGDCGADADSDGICDEVDDCIGTYDECGVCNGPGAVYECGCDGIPMGLCNCDGSDQSCVGCPYEEACNYDPNATVFDVSICEFGACPGCTDPIACNYNPTVLEDDGSCVYLSDFNWCNCEGEVLDVIGVCGGECQTDLNGDGICDDCADIDEDGICDEVTDPDSCILDDDNDGIVNCEDPCPNGLIDLDGDSICDPDDNCIDLGACNYADPANGDCLYLDDCGVCGGNNNCIDCPLASNYCGEGTVWDDLSQTCIGTPIQCGPGTVWSDEQQSCVVQLPGDIDLDQCVGIPDLLALLVAWGTCVQ